ncbi:MAG: exopolygalacturonase [Clostridia bacterium]|nr:exopolygalacturonase [Clostridia bacterium]
MEIIMQNTTSSRPECFPDGSPISEWFKNTTIPPLHTLGRQYVLTDYGILPGDAAIQTAKIQALIDYAAAEGGGVLVVPQGEFRTGALYMRQNVHLYIARNGLLKGSADITDYPLCETRIEGQNCLYFPALINAVELNGFTLTGEGCIDGNGFPFWRSFWLRRQWNPKCTNKDEQRPRLIFLSGCSDVLVSGITFSNAAFWTNHLYKCRRVKYIGCSMLSPHEPVGGPSTDALDIDACQDVLISRCYMAVNDDAVALKGGKGPWADTAPENGANERIIIEDCDFGFCHGCLTLGSESIHNRNIILRNIQVSTGYNMLWLKFRPDTHQLYEQILVENVHGKCANFVNINPWSQFFDLQGRTDLERSAGRNISIRNCRFECDTFMNVRQDEAHYHLSSFILDHLDILAADPSYDESAIEMLQISNLNLCKKETIDFPDSVTTLADDNAVYHK